MEKYKVLFVCLGNICRSPSAEAVMKKLVKDAGLEKSIFIDSAGIMGYHEGACCPPGICIGFHLPSCPHAGFL